MNATLTPANNPVVKATAPGVAATANSPQQPGAAPTGGVGLNPTQLSGAPSWLLTGQGPVTSQIPKSTPLKASPQFPQPMAADQTGAFKQGDAMPGGEGDNRSDRLFNAKSLRKGVTHELEHTTRKSLAKEIAKDHLTEHPAYYSLDNRKRASARGYRIGQWSSTGLDVLADTDKYFRTGVLTKSKPQLRQMFYEEKQAAAAAEISPFAAAFFLGCRQRGFSLETIKSAAARAGHIDGGIAEELTGLSEAFFSYCASRSKQAVFTPGVQAGDFSPSTPGASPRLPVVPKPVAASPQAAPATTPSGQVRYSPPAPPPTPQPTPQPGARPPLISTAGVAGAALANPLLGSAANLANYAYARSPDWMRNPRRAIADQATSFRDEVLMPTAEEAGRRMSVGAQKGIDPALLSDKAVETGRQTVNKGMDTAFGGGFSTNDPNTLVGQFGGFIDAARKDGLVPAITKTWGNLTPQQQWGLLAAAGGPLAGLGLAAAGHPLLGLGVGAAGLGAGAYGLSSGSGDVSQMFTPTAPDARQNYQHWLQTSPEALDVQGMPRSQQYDWFQQQAAQRQAAPGSELARAAGAPAGPAGN